MDLRARRVRRPLPVRANSRLSFALATVVAALVLGPVASGVFVQSGVACASCHAMRPYVQAHSDGAHGQVACVTCHVTPGLGALPSEGLRGLGWLAGALGRHVPGATAVGDGPCRDCHDDTIAQTRVSRGIAVRHADFVEQPCAECHAGIAHTVASRFYRTLEMDDCMGCHKSASGDPTSCELCHAGAAERRPGTTAWRSTHGAGWESTHGMGEIKTCSACHAPRYCIGCHGVRIPHPADWVISHGSAAVAPVGEKCTTCHRPDWCEGCHGTPMPHPAGFLPAHGQAAAEAPGGTCVRCHQQAACDECHLASSHPNVPGVGMGHGW